MSEDLQERLNRATLAERLERARASASGPGFFERTFEGAKSLVLGEPDPEIEGLPELRSVLPQEFGVRMVGGVAIPKSDQGEQARRLTDALFALSGPRNDEGKAANLLELLPGARFERTKKGNVRVTLPSGRQAVLNAPGLSREDVADLAVEAAFQAPAMKAAGAVGRAAGAAGRVVGTGAGAAGGAVARDVATGQPIDPSVAIASGAGGVAGEVLAPFLGVLTRALTSKRMFSGGKLTREGAQFLSEEGIDAATIDEDFARAFNEALSEGATPSQALTIAQAKNLPTPVPLSRGDVTRSVADQNIEDAAIVGARGEQAQEVAAGFRSRQQSAIRENLKKTQEDLGGGVATVEEVGEGIARAQKALREARTALNIRANQIYDAARAADVEIPADISASVFGHMRRKLADGDFIESVAPRTFNVLNDVDKAFAEVSELGIGGIDKFKLNIMERHRQRLTKIRREAAGTSEGKAASEAVAAYDEAMEEMISQALLREDIHVSAKNALKQYREAGQLWARMRQTFDGKGGAAKIVNQITNDDLDTEQALRLIFGHSGVGFKNGARQALETIKDVLGEKSTAWKGLKEEGFLRLLRTQDQGNVLDEAMRPLLSGDKFASAFNNAMSANKELMRILYTPEEITKIAKLKNVFQRATNRVRGATNPPMSGRVVERMVNNLGFLGRAAQAVVTGSFNNIGRAARTADVAARFASPIPPRPVGLQPGISRALAPSAGVAEQGQGFMSVP